MQSSLKPTSNFVHCNSIFCFNTGINGNKIIEVFVLSHVSNRFYCLLITQHKSVKIYCQRIALFNCFMTWNFFCFRLSNSRPHPLHCVFVQWWSVKLWIQKYKFYENELLSKLHTEIKDPCYQNCDCTISEPHVCILFLHCTGRIFLEIKLTPYWGLYC